MSRALVLADEQIFPVRSGGQLLIAHEISALQMLFDVQVLICTRQDSDNSSAPADTLVFPRKSLMRGMLLDPLSSYQFSSRAIWPLVRRRLGELKPCALIICHHEWMIPLALKIREHWCRNAKIVLRSHNDEYSFFSSLRSSSRGWRRAYYLLEMLRMSRQQLANHAASADDVWALTNMDRESAFSRLRDVEILPPALIAGRPERRTQLPPKRSLAFLGSLDMAHAVDGLEWFIKNVLPVVVRLRPDCTLYVGGRRAPKGLLDTIKRTENVVYVGEVDDARAFVRSHRVYINPVFSGSGINMKMGLPIEVGVPVVTTHLGLRGLDKLRDAIFQSDSADEQAGEIDRLLTSDTYWIESSASLTHAGGAYSIDNISLQMKSRVAALLSREEM
ncbi:glycosyltransferase [Pseudonocardia spirodelae]|uniref:Glycosyltransferase family 4 protein n=1 Tax=Pseudonocardia spirodelae TaxID=3133431 RepID=A0ABU8T4E9_9PSEU